ncbi:MAG: rane protein [Proteobacteria bacterium]|nr:rane protein [Pseudomonadota bacterium]
MWIGIIIGLLLGGAFGSFMAAVILAILGGLVGAMVARKGEVDSGGAALNDGSPASLRRQVHSLQAQMQQANQRIAQIERQVQQLAAGHRPPEAAAYCSPAAGAADSAATAPVADEELSRQALAADVESEAWPAEHPALLAEDLQVQPDVLPSAFGRNPVPLTEPVSRPEVSPLPPAVDAVPAFGQTGTSFSRRPVEPAPLAEASWLSKFVARWILGGNPLVKIGVLILFLGFAFLLRYVAENTVLPIELRYAGVAAAGIGLLLFGWRWRNKPDSYGLILQGAGVGVLYLTTLAGMKLHPLIPPELGFVVLIGVAAFAAGLAILQNALALAVVAALGGFAAPLLASTGSEHHLAFFAYLTVINLGIVAIAWFKAWRVLNLIGFGCTFFLASAWGDKYYRPELFAIVEPFLLLFFALYVLVAFLFARRTLADAEADESLSFAAQARHLAARVSYVDGSLVFGVPLSTFGLQYLVSRSFENGPAFSALGFGLAYIVLAFGLFRRSGRRYALLSETMIALAVIFASLAIPLGLEGEWTSAAWAVEAAGVYWVGVRQQRVHARLFALLLLFGSALYFVPDLRLGDGDSVLDGSWLGCLMLTLAMGWTYRLLRQIPAAALPAFERGLRTWLLAFACFFLALLPFLLWAMDWAATALAILGGLAVFAARRLAEPALLNWGCAYQLLGGLLFTTTLQRAADGSALANGWRGLLTAALIGLAMLFAAWATLRQPAAPGEPSANDEAAGGAVLFNPVLLGGLLFINLTPLFVLPWRIAGMLWPLTAVTTLWWALRSHQRGALGFALGLQLVAGLVFLGGPLSGVDRYSAPGELTPFLHSGFWSPLLIALAAFFGARLLQRRDSAAAVVALGWGSLAWSLAWWSTAWSGELSRLLAPETAVVGGLLVAVLTAAIGQAIARRYDWRQLGQATLAYLPVLAVLLVAHHRWPETHPLAGWGGLVWPLALLVHVRLLRVQGQWLQAPWRQGGHVLGVWLFLVLTMLEVHWHFAAWGEADSAWPSLGWLLAPLAYLWGLQSKRLGARWPLTEFGAAYSLVAAGPVILYLLGWTWLSAMHSNSAAPLPYLPLLNPAELGQFGVLLGVALWWAARRAQPAFRAAAGGLGLGLGATAFAVLSGMVLRTCHHWGGVTWRADALFASLLAQSALSIVWSVLAIGLMLFANRHRQRWLWVIGAGLMALVVGKLFLVELAASGSLGRIVSFIVVGLLLLLVGYFAPLPPRRDGGEAAPANVHGSSPG